MSAFEAITTRQAWYASEEVEKYDAVMFDAAGKYVKADGTGVFQGIVQYGAETANDMATVVKGTFPAIGSVDISAGDKVTIDATKPGRFKVAATGAAVYGVALTDGKADNLFTLTMNDVPLTIA